MNKNANKYLILIGDGMADLPIAQCNNQTPLAYAKTPHLDAMATDGVVGLCQTIPQGLAPGSDVANMSILGYDPLMYYKNMGRASIEAAAMGISLKANHYAFRCNLVNINNDIMDDYSAGHIETADAHEIVMELRTKLGSTSLQIFSGVSYRHIAVFSGIDIVGMETTPPHDISGKAIESHLPTGGSCTHIRQIMSDARKILKESLVNKRLIAEGKTPVTDIWLWGQGGSIVLPHLKDLYGLEGSVITAVDLVRGIGTLAGLYVASVIGATGYLGTNYKGKVAAAHEALTKGNFAYLHIEAPDETSHEGDVHKKIQAIEEFDSCVVGPCRLFQKEFPNLTILAMPDHATLISTKTHDAMPVPFVVCGNGIKPSGKTVYSEESAVGSKPLSAPQLFSAFVTNSLPAQL